ncbi:hypothetical protein CPB84DRAFT_1778775 [Gymnopilus junonius]|uniref:Eisosome component PIL1-domain-containing protein n=1 Tax=Gymnopilus junonius TaxID=109634 RepID=A0A9P5NPU4_GYMJU|nr:hypothetical protein CPB84DRAFT_1778775 [Gymnopilus junonius]
MFKTAATRIAHNSTIPALGGNQDLRPLQDLITAEKAVLISLQKLSVDYSKASEALRTWGLNEGDDLGDILSASTTILNHYASALSQYASHGHAVRDHLKAIRTREESLEDLKRRRRTVHRKAEDAEKKLSKMNPEHKNLQMQTETLNRLRDEIRTMDSDIMLEEAALGDFKRTATRMFMGLKFGGLQECCEKGKIVAEYGKVIISEISEELTQPGLPRVLYYGQSRTEHFVAETHRAIDDIALQTVPSVGFRDRRHYDGTLPDVHDQTPLPSIPQEMPPPEPQSAFQFSAPAESQSTLGPVSNLSSGPWSSNDYKPQPVLPPVNTDYLSTGKPYDDKGSGVTVNTGGSSFLNQPFSPQLPQAPQLSSPSFSQGQNGPPQIPGLTLQTVDDFGLNINSRSDGPIDTSNTSGGRFATFPVKTRAPGSSGGYSLSDSPPRHEQEPSFSASIAEALDDRMSQETGGATEGTDRHRMTPWGRNGHAQPLPPPPGAALPADMSNGWSGSNTTRDEALQVPSSHGRGAQRLSSNDDALLAYMTMGSVDEEEEQNHEGPTTDGPGPGGSQIVPQSQAQAQPQPLSRSQSQSQPDFMAPPSQEDEQHRISRHVRFGEVEDVDEEMEKRESLEKERQGQEPVGGDRSRLVESPQPDKVAESEPEQGPVEPSKVPEGISPASIGSSNNDRQRRVPAPSFIPEDERALNAAAAREVTKELEALKINPPLSPVEVGQGRRERNEQPLSPVERGRMPFTTTIGGATGYNDQPRSGRDLSPLPPPSMPFANRSVSPHPYAELNPNPATSSPYGPPYSSNNSPSPSYQQGPYSNQSPYGSPAQGYTQPSYDPQNQGPIPTSSSSSLPPRFQALQQQQSLENPIPPRFQAAARSQSPGSPIHSSLPPRFQTGDSPKVPAPALNLPERTSSPSQQEQQTQPEQSGGRLQALKAAAAGETSSVTPPEYPSPRQLGASPAWNKSSSSLNLKSPSPALGAPAPGARTISAAAFKRPRNTSSDTLHGGSGSGEFVKKSLPSSPYPRRDTNASETAPPPPPAPVPAQIAAPAPDSGARPLSTLADGDDDHYDYISAYVNNSNPNSPSRGEFAPNANSGGGYGEGKFATDLDSGLR